MTNPIPADVLAEIVRRLTAGEITEAEANGAIDMAKLVSIDVVQDVSRRIVVGELSAAEAVAIVCELADAAAETGDEP